MDTASNQGIDILSYDHYLVAFSGGKDSTACVLHLLELGVPKEKIELHHHLVDGRGPAFMDWEVTESYCEKFAEAFGIPIYFSWLDGGFEQEMTRNDRPKNATMWEAPGLVFKKVINSAGGKSSRRGTRMVFPQITAKLSQRWCSAYLKIDVCSIMVNNSPRFDGKRVLIISGERAEESTGRACYAEFETERSTYNQTRRTVERWRPIHKWTERQVWDIIERWKVHAHPCYYIGFSRCSCKFCIFGNADQFLSAATISPEIFGKLVAYEQQFGKTLKRKLALATLVEQGKVYEQMEANLQYVRQAVSTTYYMPIIIEEWTLPGGAFGDSDGPQ